MALTITFKRKFYNNTSNMEDAGQTAGGAIGGIYGMKTGATAGAIGGAAIGTIGGAIGGAAEVYNARAKSADLTEATKKSVNEYQDAIKAEKSAKSAYTRADNKLANTKGKANIAAQQSIVDTKAQAWADAEKIAKEKSAAAKKAGETMMKNETLAAKNAGKNALAKAGKWGLLTAGGMAVAGGLLGRSTGKDVGGAAGQAAGGLVGSASDRIVNLGNNQRQYSVSQVTKNVWNSTKKYIPRSKRMKVARKLVKTDQGFRTVTQAAQVSPGTVVEAGFKEFGKNPLTTVPGYTLSTGLLTAAKKGRLTTPDMVLKNTMIGKPVYAATEYTGKKVGRMLNPVVDAMYNASRTLAI